MSNSPAAQRVADYRARLRQQGLRPIQLWVPDTRIEGFAAAIQRQTQLIVDDPESAEILAAFDSIAEETWDEHA